MRSQLRIISALSLLALSAIASTQGQMPAPRRHFSNDSYNLREHYKKLQYMIPMRDGVKLFTNVYVPTEVSGKHPILLERTPYGAGPFAADAIPRNVKGSQKMKDAGYIFALQDVRGKGYSEGDYVNIRPQLKPGEKGIDESTDTWDTVDYLVKNVPDNNGHVGMWGISYPGFYAGVGGIDTHPALTAISPQAPVSDWFIGDDFHHNGAFFQRDLFDFCPWFNVPRLGIMKGGKSPHVDWGNSDYDFYLNTGALPNFDKKWFKGTIPYWNEVMDHGTYDDYWKDRSLTRHLDNIKCAVLVVGGWFDAEDMWGALHDYQSVKAKNPATVDWLVMGPWSHGMWAGPKGRTLGDMDFGQDTSAYFQDNIEFPFFDAFLRGEKRDAYNTKNGAKVFETGRNVWHSLPQWPPAGLTDIRFYLAPNANLATTEPNRDGEVTYVYDPANPTPYVADYKTTKARGREYMIDDQRFAEARPDVVTFKSSPMLNDLTVAGPIDADLWVKTTGTDGDFVVKIIDVWPSDSEFKSPKGLPMFGYEQLLKGDIFRGKFRNSFENPEPFKPGQPTEVHFKLNDCFHTFLKGHRVMVQIQSAWFPLVDRNSNSFEDLYHAKDEDFHPATISVLFDKKHPTSVGFGQLK